MLPSRGIVRSLPSAGAPRQFANRNVAARTFPGTGRQFGTIRRTVGGVNGLSAASGSPLKGGHVIAPIALGSVASARNLSLGGFSLWGYGKKNGDAASTSSTSAAEVSPSGQAADKAVEASSAATTPPVESAASTPSPVDAAQTDLSAISDLVNSGSEILTRAEDIGYLSSLGLNYGWGPTSAMQWCLEHVHVYTGLGWAGTIMTTALLMRVAMLYTQVKSTKFSQSMKRMQEDPRYPEVTAQLQKAIRNGDRMAQQQAQSLNNLLRQEYNVPLKDMAWSFVPIPFSIGLFRVITGMTHLPVPSLENAGFLWFTDLTVADPYMLLPALATGMMVLSIKINMVNSTPSQAKMMQKMQYILVPIMILGTSFLSAAVNLMGAALGVATLGSTALLNNNAVRRQFGIPEITPSKPAAPAPEPVKPMYEAPRQAESMRDRLTNSLDDVKKSMSDGVTKMTGSYSGTKEEQAERKRKEFIRKLEEKRKEQEREHFEEKYKGKR